MKIQTCKYISIADVAPKKWSKEFWDTVCEIPFSWGDNSHSLIPAETFADACERLLVRKYTLPVVPLRSPARFIAA